MVVGVNVFVGVGVGVGVGQIFELKQSTQSTYEVRLENTKASVEVVAVIYSAQVL